MMTVTSTWRIWWKIFVIFIKKIFESLTAVDSPQFIVVSASF